MSRCRYRGRYDDSRCYGDVADDDTSCRLHAAEMVAESSRSAAMKALKWMTRYHAWRNPAPGKRRAL